MVSTHKGMNITDSEFGALVEDLIKALDKHKVPEKEKGELLGILGPMKPAIVGPKSPAKLPVVFITPPTAPTACGASSRGIVQ